MANLDPHTHEPTIKRHYMWYDGVADGPWELTYGDTTTWVCFGFIKPRRWMIAMAMHRAIKEHDRGSSKLTGNRKHAQEATVILRSLINTENVLDHKGWGSELLTKSK